MLPKVNFKHKKTGLVGPVFSSVEVRCGYIAARRKTDAESGWSFL